MMKMKVQRPKRPAQPVCQEQLMRASLLALQKDDQRINMARLKRAEEYKSETALTTGQQKTVRARQIARSRRTLAEASTKAHLNAANRRQQVLSDLMDRNSRPEEWKEATKETLQAREIGSLLTQQNNKVLKLSESGCAGRRFTSPLRFPHSVGPKKENSTYRADSLDNDSLETDLDTSQISQISLDGTTPRQTEQADALSLAGPSSSRSETPVHPTDNSRLLFPRLSTEMNQIVDAETGEKLELHPKKWSYLKAYQSEPQQSLQTSIHYKGTPFASPNMTLNDENSISEWTQDTAIPNKLQMRSASEKTHNHISSISKFPPLTPSRPDTGNMALNDQGVQRVQEVPESDPLREEERTQLLLPEIERYSEVARSRLNSRDETPDKEFRQRFRSDSEMDNSIATVSTLSTTSFEMIPPPPTKWDVLKKKLDLGEKASDKLMKTILELKSEPGLIRTSMHVQALLKLRDRLTAQLDYLIQEEEFEEARRQDEIKACAHPKRLGVLRRRHQRERERRQKHIFWFQEDAQKIIAKKLAEYDLLMV
mmetsp:Transcript_5371/g.7061  ORF Transcript_5371/g.7061 Transcript_5371/m.7061 type:complete len:541 (+) Transcript_5371:228-1850(+)